MFYFHDNFIINIASFKAIIWSFLQEYAYDCNITIVIYDVTMLLSWNHNVILCPCRNSASFVYNNHKMYNYMTLCQICTNYYQMLSYYAIAPKMYNATNNRVCIGNKQPAKWPDIYNGGGNCKNAYGWHEDTFFYQDVCWANRPNQSIHAGK